MHVGPDLVTDALAEMTGRPAGLPLFAEPVIHDSELAAALRRMHTALARGDGALRGGELLDMLVAAMVRRGATRSVRPSGPRGDERLARRARDALDELHAADLTANDLAAIAGASRFAVYRSFRAAYGMAPSDYQRQARLRSARRLLAAGARPAEAAARAGFADQSHLNRWFTRCYGITPGAYQRAGARAEEDT